jgi:hypothetical protein
MYTQPIIPTHTTSNRHTQLLSHDRALTRCNDELCNTDFRAHSEATRRLFTLKASLAASASKWLVAHAPGTVIGVHVRRNDQLNNSERPWIREPPVSFFVKALRHFRNAYSDARFVVVSDDVAWCGGQAVFKGSDVIFLHNASSSFAFAVLHQSNHAILTIGTFGWWAAWLGPHRQGGQVLYWREFDQANAIAAAQIREADYYPEPWRRVSL